MTGKMDAWLRKTLTGLLFVLFCILVVRGFLAALPRGSLMDFGSFVASGRAAMDGLDPYGIHPLTFHVTLPGFESWNPNLNPPISVIFFQLFDLLDPHTSFRVWWVTSAACYAAAVFLLVRRYGGAERLFLSAWAFALAGFWDTLVLGQIYLPLVLTAVGAWLLLERGRGDMAGLLIGILIAIKPNFLVWPALLFLAGHRRPALISGSVGGAISAIPLLIYGPEIYRQWFELIASDADRAGFLTNASLVGLTSRFGAPGLGTMLSVLLLVSLAGWAWLRRPTAMRCSELALIASLLASPLAWIHYTLFLLPVLLREMRSIPMLMAAAMLTVPVWKILPLLTASPWVTATTGSIYAWALVLCFVAITTRGRNFRTGPSSPVADGAHALGPRPEGQSGS